MTRLTNLKRIGPVTAGKIKKQGIQTVEQLAVLSGDRLETVNAALKKQGVSIRRLVQLAADYVAVFGGDGDSKPSSDNAEEKDGDEEMKDPTNRAERRTRGRRKKKKRQDEDEDDEDFLPERPKKKAKKTPKKKKPKTPKKPKKKSAKREREEVEIQRLSKKRRVRAPNNDGLAAPSRIVEVDCDYYDFEQRYKNRHIRNKRTNAIERKMEELGRDKLLDYAEFNPSKTPDFREVLHLAQTKYDKKISYMARAMPPKMSKVVETPYQEIVKDSLMDLIPELYDEIAALIAEFANDDGKSDVKLFLDINLLNRMINQHNHLHEESRLFNYFPASNHFRDICSQQNERYAPGQLVKLREEGKQPPPLTEIDVHGLEKALNGQLADTTSLFEYQEENVVWMKSVEDGKHNVPMLEEGRKCSILRYLNDEGEQEETDLFIDPANQQFLSKKNTEEIDKLVWKTRGGILADQVGLGKTLSMTALIAANPGSTCGYKLSKATGALIPDPLRYDNRDLYQTDATLIVCPSHLVSQWLLEIERHTKDMVAISITTKPLHEKITWRNVLEADAVVVSVPFLKGKYYRDAKSNPNKGWAGAHAKADVFEELAPLLHHFRFRRLVLDEGHEIVTDHKNRTVYHCVESEYRWLVTGTPFPKGTSSLSCSMHFLGVRLAGKEILFSTPVAFNYMKNHLFCRNTKKSIGKENWLPDTTEEVTFLDMHPVERAVYDMLRCDPQTKQNTTPLRAVCSNIRIPAEITRVLGNPTTNYSLNDILKIVVDYKKSDLASQRLAVMRHQRGVQENTQRIKEIKEKMEKCLRQGRTYDPAREFGSQWSGNLKNKEHDLTYHQKNLTSSKTRLRMLEEQTRVLAAVRPKPVQDMDALCSTCVAKAATLPLIVLPSCGHFVCARCLKKNTQKPPAGLSGGSSRRVEPVFVRLANELSSFCSFRPPPRHSPSSSYTHSWSLSSRSITTSSSSSSSHSRHSSSSSSSSSASSSTAVGVKAPPSSPSVFCPACKEYCILPENGAEDLPVLELKSPERAKLNREISAKLCVNLFGTKLTAVAVVLGKILSDPSSRIIVFSQWDWLLQRVHDSLSRSGIGSSWVVGHVHQRAKAIRLFQKDPAPKDKVETMTRVILLSLSKSASGSNLTKATHIVLLDPHGGKQAEAEASEIQAVGRAVRQGGSGKVLSIVKFIMKNTVEEDLYIRNNRLKPKRELSNLPLPSTLSKTHSMFMRTKSEKLLGAMPDKE